MRCFGRFQYPDNVRSVNCMYLSMRRLCRGEVGFSRRFAEKWTNAMYFGSVKFFKHLIYTVFFGWIALATFFAVFFGVKYFISEKKLSDAADAAAAEAERINIPDGTSFEQIFLALTARRYSSEEMLSLIADGDEDAFLSYIETFLSENPDIAEGIFREMGFRSAGADVSAEYTKLYPDLYVDEPTSAFKQDNGTIYLTFDDGPSENTRDVLEILEKHDIKATFFFCGGNDERSKEIMKAVADAGHTVGIHSISHDYEKIYESVESYLDDFYETYTCVYEATGIKPRCFRFPGGSINNYNRFVYMQIIAEMTRRGFVYYDWNVSGEDAARGATWSSIYENIMTGIRNNSSDRAIVLLHDAADKQTTVYVLEDVIVKLLGDGYTFGQIDDTVKPIAFSYAD